MTWSLTPEELTAIRCAELVVVIPVYNEQEAIRAVVSEWFRAVRRETDRFVIFVINDGSTDGTLGELQALKAELGHGLIIHSRPNRGHGPSCVEGYREAIDLGISFILQIDSDGQCDPQYFPLLWKDRDRFDVIYGRRFRRLDGWRRYLASLILRMVVLIVGHRWCSDPNTPYRLMRAESIRKVVEVIPDDAFFANTLLALGLRRRPEIRHGEVPIVFRKRSVGESSCPLSRFGLYAIRVIREIRRFMQSHCGPPR